MNKQTLIEVLNEDLAGELQAIIQYLTYSARVTGPWRLQLVQFMQTEIQDELLHAQFLADKIVALGGNPTTTPRPVPQAETPRQMLEAILAAELQAGKDYTLRAEQAAAFGDKGLAVQLENMILNESGHAEETAKLLKNWE